MLVYRIGKTRYAHDLTGEGARLFGGRWNHKLTPCIYTSESRALAMLEYTVNVNIEDIPRSLSLSTFEIPDKSIFHIPMHKFPGDWMVSQLRPRHQARVLGHGQRGAVARRHPHGRQFVRDFSHRARCYEWRDPRASSVSLERFVGLG